MKLNDIGELSLVEKIKKAFGFEDEYVPVPIGDDAAIINVRTGNYAIATDVMVEGVHFDTSLVTYYQVGFKLISSNVSDIYAMGATPEYVLLNVVMEGRRNEEDLDDIIDGIKDACELYNVKVIGGDVSSSLSGDFLSATVIGPAQVGIRRSGASVGDNIFVTGHLGCSSAGLDQLKAQGQTLNVRYGDPSINGMDADVFECIIRHALPVARDPKIYKDDVKSMIDVSDGLLIDLKRLCDASRIGAQLYKDRIPVSKGALKIAGSLNMDVMDYAFSGGEDYELLFTSKRDEIEGCTLIGEIIEKGFYLSDENGNRSEVLPGGYTHF
ncbi:MAG: thiamine-phosphate kinase [Nitrospirota bacterium]|nr:MAG: thiamine-phosphate kinase [Nitrospirota bacterium]